MCIRDSLEEVPATKHGYPEKEKSSGWGPSILNFAIARFRCASKHCVKRSTLTRLLKSPSSSPFSKNRAHAGYKYLANAGYCFDASLALAANTLSLWNLPAGTLRALADGRDANQLLLLLLSPPCGILLRAHMCSAGNHVPCLHLPLGGASVPATRQGSDSGPFFSHKDFTRNNSHSHD